MGPSITAFSSFAASIAAAAYLALTSSLRLGLHDHLSSDMLHYADDHTVIQVSISILNQHKWCNNLCLPQVSVVWCLMCIDHYLVSSVVDQRWRMSIDTERSGLRITHSNLVGSKKSKSSPFLVASLAIQFAFLIASDRAYTWKTQEKFINNKENKNLNYTFHIV